MEAVEAMNAQTLDKDVVDRPVINPWRQAATRQQVRWATALCRSELPYAERQRTLAAFPALDCRAMSDLISELQGMRARRMERLRGARHRRR